MGQLAEVLVKRLMKKGMYRFEILPFVKDVGRTASATTMSDFHQIGRRLHSFGWNRFELDDHTLQLTLAVLDDLEASSRCPSS